LQREWQGFTTFPGQEQREEEQDQHTGEAIDEITFPFGFLTFIVVGSPWKQSLVVKKSKWVTYCSLGRLQLCQCYAIL